MLNAVQIIDGTFLAGLAVLLKVIILPVQLIARLMKKVAGHLD